jgi:hypothetical protein
VCICFVILLSSFAFLSVNEYNTRYHQQIAASRSDAAATSAITDYTALSGLVGPTPHGSDVLDGGSVCRWDVREVVRPQQSASRFRVLTACEASHLLYCIHDSGIRVSVGGRVDGGHVNRQQKIGNSHRFDSHFETYCRGSRKGERGSAP